MRVMAAMALIGLSLGTAVLGCEAEQITGGTSAPRASVAALTQAGSPGSGADPAACALLDNPAKRARMSAALEMKLQMQCGLVDELEPSLGLSEPGLDRARAAADAVLGLAPAAPGEDIAVSNPALDTGGSTQSETSVVAVGNVVCAAWNDSGEGFGQNGFSGFGYSHDGGLTFIDGGPHPNGPDDMSFGDPSLAYSTRDNAFYFAALSQQGLSLWRSDDDCQSFQYVGPIHLGFGDDKELIAVDNTPTSPYFGRIHVGWTDFAAAGDSNVTAYSDDGGATWTAPAALPESGFGGQGMWPAVAPNGDVYFALAQLALEVGGLQNQWIYRSADGGDSYVQMTNIGSDQLRPENVNASGNCGRQALNGDVRNLSSPQIAISLDDSAAAGYVVHAVYPYDSDGDGPDESNVFYRQSSDGAQTWSPELKVNDDETATDQYYPTLAVTDDGTVAVSWYDRRLDPVNNFMIDRFVAYSLDGGATFGENERLSDVSTPIGATNPHFDGLAFCYHGDYDQAAIVDNTLHVVWSDDRRVTETGPNPDVYYDQVLLNPSLGRVRAAQAAIACGAAASFRLTDADLAGTGSVAITLTTDGGDAETLVLTEDPSRPGAFTGDADTAEGAVAPGDGLLQVAHGTVVTATYQDENDGEGEGGTAVATAQVVLDCQAAAISDVRTTELGGTRATIAFDPSEPVTATVEYGFACDALTRSASSAGLSASPTVVVQDLLRGTTYYFAVTSADRVGNVSRDDNAGECYSFRTLDAVFSTDFEDGLSGFEIDGTGENLWHLSTGCAAQVFGHTRPTALYYGVDATCTYQTAETNLGIVTSPVIHVANSAFVGLEFAFYLGTEGGGFYDQASVAVSVDGGEFVVVDSNFSTLNPRKKGVRKRADAVGAGGVALRENTGEWQHAAIDLTPLLDGASEADIRVRFGFDTIDGAGNEFAGFYVDDVAVLGELAPEPCSSGADCDDGLFCNGAETCSAGLCAHGTPVSCTSDDGIGCTDEVCDEARQACVSHANDEHCDDGAFCNGFEVCDPELDCQPSSGEVACSGDGIDCTVESCDEMLKGCRRTPDDFACDDGLFCNGIDVCNVLTGCESFPACQDGVACTQDVCFEEGQFCDFVPEDALCDDGLFCTGVERCEPGLGCATSGDPCPGPDLCDETANACQSTCFTDTNVNHTAAGRAYSRRNNRDYFAVGSNDTLGRGTAVTSLSGGGSFWQRVSSCPQPPTIDSLHVEVIGDGATVSGTASDPNDDITLVRLTFSTMFVGQFTVDAAGTEDWSVTLGGLFPGFAYTVSAQAFDSTGFASEPTPPVEFVVMPPIPPMIESISATSGTSAAVSGTASDDNNDLAFVYVSVFSSDTLVTAQQASGTTSWTTTFSALAPGVYSASAQAFDQSGLVSPSSERVSFEITQQCIRARNSEHKSAGRAYSLRTNRDYYAFGSDDYLGSSGRTITALRGSPGFWELVSGCP
jgi:hypothetical protein